MSNKFFTDLLKVLVFQKTLLFRGKKHCVPVILTLSATWADPYYTWDWIGKFFMETESFFM